MDISSIVDQISKILLDDRKIIEYIEPSTLKTMFNLNKEDLQQEVDKIIKYSVNTNHLSFFNQLYTGTTVYGVIGELLTAILNTSMYTYEVAPVFTIMEELIFNEILNLFGFTDGEAIFSPGGSMSNIYALHTARYNLNKDINKIGNVNTMTILCSDHSHYSIKKGASLLGIGYDNVIQIKSDRYGRMIPSELEHTIKEIECPLIIVSTAGTTVFGAYDPIDEIDKIAKKYNIWHHVDASWGGAAIFSKKHRYKLKGIENVDSITFNPHKMLRVPLQSSIFMVKKKILEKCNSLHAKYLFQKDKFYDVAYDTGDKYIQCGRKNDILKLWLPWKMEDFESNIDTCFENAKYFRDKIESNTNFKLVIDRFECTNVCFWYIPKRFQLIEYGTKQLNMVAPKMKELMVKDGNLMIGYQPLGLYPNFFRIVFINPKVNYKDIDSIIDKMITLGSGI